MAALESQLLAGILVTPLRIDLVDAIAAPGCSTRWATSSAAHAAHFLSGKRHPAHLYGEAPAGDVDPRAAAFPEHKASFR